MDRGAVRALPLHAVAVAVLALGLAFAVWRLSAPTECAWVPPSSSAWTDAGVRPNVPAGCTLTEGQTVTQAEVHAESVGLALEDGSQVTLPRTAPGQAVAERIGQSASTIAFVVALFAITLYAVRRRPQALAPAALVIFASGLLGSTFATMTGLPPSAVFSGTARWLWFVNVQAVFLLSWGAMIASLLHFPAAPVSTSRRPHSLTWSALLAPVSLWGVLVLIAALRGPSFTALVRTSIIVQSSVTVLVILISLAMLVDRVRRALRSDPADVARQQVLWVAGSALVSGALSLGVWMVPELVTGSPLLPNDAIGAPGLLFVAGLAVAMLRFKLFDLDVVLTRTIVYSLLLLAAVVTYLTVTAVLAALFTTVAAAPIAAIGAVVVALATNPLRVRLERVVNRVFYGDRQEPYAALSRIAQHVADRRNPLASVTDDIRRSLRVPYLAIEPEDADPVASGRPEALAHGSVDLPIASSEELLGRVVLARRGRGERFSTTERRLLDDIARELGGRLRADRMTRDLQESRERIVTAREEERRALRRTLHDDIGPTMAAVALRAETARRSLATRTSPDDVDALLGQIARTASQSAEALRSLAYDLRPPVLDELGLVGAVRLLADAVPGVNVHVVVNGLDHPTRAPLGAAGEVAAYRIIRSALDNVTHHAAATTCWVRLARGPAQLDVLIEDDGIGMPSPASRGVGLTAMSERAAELGGTCTILARPEGGTVVRATLPTSAAAHPATATAEDAL